MHFRLTNDSHTVNAVITDDGADWRVEVISHENGAESIPWKVFYRYFSTRSDRPDSGMLEVSRKLRGEFGITGNYTQVEG